MEEVNFCVPTGNFGNVLAGYYAKLMGLPIHKLIVASNANHVLYDFLTSGVYDRNRPFHKTISPSMDILISSNLERLLYYKSGKNAAYIQMLMERLETRGSYRIEDELLKDIQNDFVGGYCDDEQCAREIKAIRLCVNMLGRTKNMYVYCYLRQVLINLRQAYIKRYLKRVIWTNLRVWRNLKGKAVQRFHRLCGS